MKIKCSYCEKEIEKFSGHVNRARKLGLNIYCDRVCSGMGRRKGKTEEQKKAEKSAYDKIYCLKNKEKKRLMAKEYFKKDYAENPEKYREWRRKRQPKHNDYCRRPEYKAWKKEYDKKYRAKKNFGELWESALLINEIENEVDNRQVKQQLQLINKSQKRKRSYEKFKREELERSIMGNPK